MNGWPHYTGPCPPLGNAPQHDVFTLIAMDLDPADLKPGLTVPELLNALKGRSRGAAGLVLRYAQ